MARPRSCSRAWPGTHDSVDGILSSSISRCTLHRQLPLSLSFRFYSALMESILQSAVRSAVLAMCRCLTIALYLHTGLSALVALLRAIDVQFCVMLCYWVLRCCQLPLVGTAYHFYSRLFFCCIMNDIWLTGSGSAWKAAHTVWLSQQLPPQHLSRAPARVLCRSGWRRCCATSARGSPTWHSVCCAFCSLAHPCARPSYQALCR